MESRKREKRDEKNSSLKERLDKLAEDIRRLPPNRVDQLERLIHTMGKKVVSIKEAAEILDVSRDTIRRAIKAGSIKAIQLNREGTWRITIEELERFMRGGE